MHHYTLGGSCVDHTRKSRSGRRILLIVIGAVLIYAGLLLAIGLIGGRLERQEASEPVGSLEGRFPSESITLESGGRLWQYRSRDLTNLLLIGTDWEKYSSTGGTRYSGQADFLMLVTLDRKNRAVTALQLDRDTITKIRIYGPFGDYLGTRDTQLCLAYAYGDTPEESRENTVWAVSRLLGGIPVDGCVILQLSGISALNDSLGGITVTLDEDFSASDPAMTKGSTLTLRGQQAEYYVRGRMNVGDGTNVSRMSRQRTFLLAAQEKLTQMLKSDADFAATLLNSLSGHMTTDRDQSWLIDRAYEASSYSYTGEILTPSGTHGYNDRGFAEFRPDEAALSGLLTELYFEQC